MTPSGIILSSGSKGATQEDIAAAFRKNGLEPEMPETAETTETAETEAETAETEREEAEEVNEGDPGDETQDDAEPKPKLSRKQRAIDRATRELREENRKLAERIAALEPKGKAAEVKEPVAPKREDFPSDEAFEDAKFDFRYQQRRAKEQAEAQAASLKTEREAHWENYGSNVEEFKETHADWDEVVNDKVRIHAAVYEAIVAEENPELPYYLGKHPDYAEKLAKMQPFLAVIEIGRLAERLKKTAAAPKPNSGAPPKPKPKIPAPVEPTATSATSSTVTTRTATNYKDFKKAIRAGR